MFLKDWARLSAALLAMVVAGNVAAHPVHGLATASPLLAGLAHPLFGIDHLLALLAVGIWSARAGLRGQGIPPWMPPALFTTGLLTGVAAGLVFAPLQGTETLIASTVLLLGVLVAVGLRLSASVALPAMLLFAMLHGMAHGHEAPAGDALAFALGVCISSLVLQCAGLALGSWLQRHAGARRGIGGMVALAGLALLAS